MQEPPESYDPDSTNWDNYAQANPVFEVGDPRNYMDYVRDDIYQEVSDYSSGKDVGCLSTLLMFAIGGAGLIYTLAIILT